MHLIFEPIASHIHDKAHIHTPTHPYQVPHSTIIQQRRRCLGYHCCCFSPHQRGALLAPLASSVYHTTAVARVIDAILPTTATPAVALAALGRVQHHERSFGGFRLSPTPPTRLDDGSWRAKNALLKKNARSTGCQPIFDSHTAVLPHTNRL